MPPAQHASHDRPRLIVRWNDLLPAPLWRVYGCGALCAAGVVCGLVYILTEAGYHHELPAHAVRTVGGAVTLGAVLGLWLPRRLIRRRLSGILVPRERPNDLARQSGAELRMPVGRVEDEFAGALTGALVLALGMMWTVTLGLTAGLESWRAAIVGHVWLPRSVTRMVLLAPMTLGLLLVGAVGTTSFVGLHGWCRLHAESKGALINLWLVMLASGAAASGACTSLTLPAASALGALLCTFLSGFIAVVGRPAGAGAAEPRLDHPRDLASLWQPLLAALLAGFLAGGTLVSLGPANPALCDWSWLALGNTTGALLGVIVIRVLVPAAHAMRGLVTCVLLGTAAWYWSQAEQSGVAALYARAALAGGTLAGTALLAARGGSAVLGGPQPTLAWVGVTVAVGLGLGLTVAPRRPDKTVNPSLAPAAEQVLIRELLTASGQRTIISSVSRDAAARGGQSAWDLDLDGPRWDVVLVEGKATATGTALTIAEGRRLAARVRASLRAGGRLVVAAHEPALVAALRQEGAELYVLRFGDHDVRCEAVLCGPDIPAWIEALPALAGYDIDLRAWRDSGR